MKISRLGRDDAPAVVDCFRRVYGESYANDLFYDAAALAQAMAAGRIGSVGAADDNGLLVGHMAMTVKPEASVIELGNTVVDPAARGHGVAWQVGAELTRWCRELGYRGFLHYPTTDHHIMQRQSVKQGFETGLMLGYIPLETDGKVQEVQVHAHPAGGRQAATIVYEPLAQSAPASAYLPEYCADQVRALARDTGLERHWLMPAAAASIPESRASAPAEIRVQSFEKRGLVRLDVARVGAGLLAEIDVLGSDPPACQQIDFSMADPGIDAGVRSALGAGFWFCGWLPGYGTGDVLRLQRVDRSVTEMAPLLVNPVARSLLALVP